MSTLNPGQWQEISPYLDHALSLTEEEREAWLESFREEKPTLAKVLEELLEEHCALEKERFLEYGPLRPLNPDFSWAGHRIGAYTLLSQIGQGGMSTVWLAKRSDGRFERQVAVKFLQFAMSSGVGAERFKREGKILGQLTHPHIAELMDAGVTDGGEPYLVLEYVEGQPIDQYCDQHNLDVEARIRLFLDVMVPPVIRPPMCACQAMMLCAAKLKPRFRTIRNTTWRESTRSRRDSTNQAPNRPKIAPDAPLAPWLGCTIR
jgi:eukaryotic-like serine/threonine-protein kinase